jgi:micrococcal nuclease
MYEYKARLIRVIDGDTIDADIDLGFGVWVRQRIKLYGINTPDSKSKDPEVRDKGIASRNKLIEILPREFVVQTILNKRGKFGRVLGNLFVQVDEHHKQNINDTMVEEGVATHYFNS